MLLNKYKVRTDAYDSRRKNKYFIRCDKTENV